MKIRNRLTSSFRRIDDAVVYQTGIGAFEVLVLGVVAGSMALYLSGKKNIAVVAGLCPVALLGLKAICELETDQV